MMQSDSGGSSTSPSYLHLRKNDSSINLFGKVAAASKEKVGALVSSNLSEAIIDRSRKIIAHFPEINHGYLTRKNGLNKTSFCPKKVTAKSAAQNLRWLKQTQLNNAKSDTENPSKNRFEKYDNKAKHGVSAETSKSSTPSESFVRPSTASNLNESTRYHDRSHDLVHGVVKRPNDSGPIVRELVDDKNQRPRTTEGILRGAILNQLSAKEEHSENAREALVDQDIYFAVATDVPIIYRNQKAKSSNPERLNLDRRNLRVIPLLEGEQMLRLLNLQNNIIARIDNLLRLPNLIFLDLYNNRIEKLDNLHVVSNLRVLMLGKNRIKTIQNLEGLQKLDVLDLHSNEIEVIENLNELKELRVLNLGGNKIKVLENIEHLGVLTELNLRRNLVERIGNLGKLVNLQRLFLSNNRLETFESIDPLLALRSISELRLECNKISASKQEEYRTRMIHYFPSLKYLDLKPLTDSERKEAAILYPERIKDGLQLENASHKRIEGIKSARLWWEKSAQRIKNGIRRAKWNDSCLWDLPSCNEDITSLTEESSCDILTEVANGSTGLIGNEKRKLLGREEYCTFNNLAGFAEIEVYEGDYRVLCIYGDALDVMENVKYHTCIDAILFKYISLQKIGSFLCTSSTGNIKLFGRLRKLIFSHNDITSFEQMAWLASTGNRGEEIFLNNSPICSLRLIRGYVAAQISNVIKLNGEDISASDRALGRQFFPCRAHQKRIEQTKSNSTVSNHARNIGTSKVITTMNELIWSANEIKKKHDAVDSVWQSVLTSLVRDAVLDVECYQSLISNCLDGL